MNLKKLLNMTYDGNMDRQCVDLCDAANLYTGIKTICSCCGHGKTPYRIWFKADNLEVLPRLLYFFSACHCGFPGWRIEVSTDCVMSPVSFCITGPIGKETYRQSKEIAQLLKQYSDKRLNVLDRKQHNIFLP